jgi:hypothetical protein
VNVPLFTRLEGCIECTQRDSHPVFLAFLPEKLRSTLAAERASSCWGGPVFSKQVCAGEQPQVTLRDTAMCCKGCSMCLAAHGAVAVCGGSQFRAQLIPNASAKATPSMCRFGHLPLPALTLIEPHRTTARVPFDTTTISQPPEISGCSYIKADQFLAATKRPVLDGSNGPERTHWRSPPGPQAHPATTGNQRRIKIDSYRLAAADSRLTALNRRALHWWFCQREIVLKVRCRISDW